MFIMKKILYTLFLLSSLSIACQKDTGGEPIDEAPAGEPSFVIASYNILHDTPDVPEHYNWEIRKSLLTDQVKQRKIDILCLQEDWDNQAIDIQSALGYQSVGRTKRIMYDGNRFRLKTQGLFYLSETPEKSSTGWDASGPRHCNWALFNDRHTKRDFYVFNVHFDHIGVVSREQSALLMKDRLQKMTNGLPVFVTGDFNTTPGTRPILTMSSVVMASRGLSESLPQGPVGTFNGMDVNRDYTGRIDYIFVSNHIKVHQYTVLAEPTNNIFPSDHFPVIIKAELK